MFRKFALALGTTIAIASAALIPTSASAHMHGGHGHGHWHGGFGWGVGASAIALVAVQYPMRELAPLREMLGDPPDVIFVDNEAVFREALRAHLKHLEIREQELRDRKGYETGPKDSGDLSGWEAEASWPEEWPEATFGSIVLLLRTKPCQSSY